MLYVLNVGESDAPRLHEKEEEFRARCWGRGRNTAVAGIGGKIEAELAELSTGRSARVPGQLRTEGIRAGAADLRDSTRLLGLMSFLTAGETEVRAWTIPIGSTAVKAAGAIHSDFEKKFIRAETVNWKRWWIWAVIPACARRACCASKARSTSSRTAMYS